MLLPWRGAHYLCATVLILLAYFKTSTGQTGVTITTEPAAGATTTVTTEAPTTLEPTTPLPDLNPPENVTVDEEETNNTAFRVFWDHDPGPRLNIEFYINVEASDGSEPAENKTGATSGDIIGDKTPGQEYDITVVAVDDANSDMARSVPQTFRLSPNMVAGLTREDSNSSAVTARWVRPSGEVSGYRVTCSDGEPYEVNITDADETEASCSGDIAGKEVTMTVRTVSDDKESSPGMVTIRANPNPVEDLKERSANTSSVTATWTAPDGEVDDYNVTCSSGIVLPFVNNGNQYEASCTGIEAGEDITVTVSSVSGNVESIPRSVTITAYPNAVVLRESDATTERVTVAWTKPTGTFDAYEGSCSDGSLDEPLNKDSESATCTGVTPGIVVTVTVKTISGDKESNDTLDVTAIPNAVVNLIETDATTSSVTVSWTAPGDIFDSYSVSCSDGDLDGNLDVDSTEATCTKVTGGDLVTVTVYTISGEKNNSNSVDVRALPYSVVKLLEVGATMTTIEASWQFPGGVVSKYEVSCSAGTANPQEVPEDNSIEYSSICEGLQEPGDNYTMTVTSVSGRKSATAETVQITAVPASPDLLGLPSTVQNVSVRWSHPEGIVDYFEVKCEPDSISRPMPGYINAEGTPPYEAACEVDRPGELFNLSVISVSGDKKSSVSVEPLRALPESLMQLTIVNFSTDAVTLKWCISARCQDGGYNWTSITVTVQTDEINSSYEGNDTYDEVITSEEIVTDGNFIIIKDLIPGECYNFTCSVVNYEGKSCSKSIWQCTLPEAVKSFTVENITANMVELRWEMKDRCQENGCVWSSFDVSHNPDFFEKNVSEDEMSTSFTSLTPGESYNFTIIVLSEEEESSPVTVADRTIPESVGEFNIAQYSTDFVELYWTIKEMCKDDKCVWDSYNLTYTSDGNPEDQQPGPPLDSASLRTNVTSLTPGENYNFFIIAVSGEKGSSSTPVVQRTKPETVEEFNVTSYSTEMVKLSWTIKTMCENGGCVWDTYNVSYVASSDTGGTPLEESRSSSSNEIEINDLTPGENYNFSITVLSGEEESDFKTVVQRTLPESVHKFMVAAYSNNDVTLSWTMTNECENGDCVWTSFEISWDSNQKDDITDAATRNVSIDSLTPGKEYTFDIIVLSYDEFSTPKNTTQRLRPNNVGELRVPSEYSSQIAVEWNEPGGIVSGYDTTITGTDGYFNTKNVAEPEVTYPDLTPGVYYNVTVCTRSFEENCTVVASRRIRTVPSLPSAPVAVSLRALSISSVSLTFQEPLEPNGVIQKYVISYTGSKSEDLIEDSGGREVEANGGKEFSEIFIELWPGFTYVFVVLAVNEAGEGDEASANIVLGQEKPVDSTVPPDEVASSSSADTEIKTFTVQFSSALFSHCNGELKNYSVFVVQDGGNDTIGDPPRSYDDAQKQKTLPVYLAIVEKEYPFTPDYSSCTSQRKKRQTTDSVDVVIGDGTCSEDGRYCNGALHGNREYRVRYRACNDAGCSFSPYSEVIKTVLNPASWVVPLVLIILILLCALIVAGVWRERKQPGSVTGYFKREKKGIDNRAFESDKPMRRQGDNRPVKLAEFGQFLEDMSRDSDYLFSEEYNDLRPIGKNQSTDAAQLEVNRVKNRFSNILPYDHTRVSLSPIDDEEGSDYINANYMLGYRSQREYIACQGPLQSTEEDMWRLVWEQGASIIVMVTQLMENGKIKCHQYWPDEGEGPVRYGDIVVNPGQVEKAELWTIRKFQITKGPVTRSVTHFNFIAWPDHGVPERPDDLIKFVEEVRASKKNDGKPMVVHCSAGVGRTGTFISLDHLMSAVKENDEVDIYGMVRKMRMNRCMMVQTESQYIFIHQCVMALLEGTPGESDAVYENVNGNGYFNEALI